MRNWNNVDDRREATIAFANSMKDPSNTQIRQQCIDDPKEAKKQFAKIGQFYLEGETIPPEDGKKIPIPQRVQFKVYDATDPKRHDLVILVLPSAKGQDSDEATDIWIAAWPPWVGLTP